MANAQLIKFLLERTRTRFDDLVGNLAKPGLALGDGTHDGW